MALRQSLVCPTVLRWHSAAARGPQGLCQAFSQCVSQILRFVHRVYRSFWKCVSVCVAKSFRVDRGVLGCFSCPHSSISVSHSLMMVRTLCTLPHSNPLVGSGFRASHWLGHFTMFKTKIVSKTAVCLTVYLRNVWCASVCISKFLPVYPCGLRYTPPESLACPPLTHSHTMCLCAPQ